MGDDVVDQVRRRLRHAPGAARRAETVLLGWRANRPAQNAWFVPGGRIRKDERVSQALARLLQTELGLAPADHSPPQFLGAFEHLYADNALDAPGFGTHYVVLAYTLQLQPDAPLQADAQHAGLRWWDLPTLLADLSVHENTRAYFDSAVGNTRLQCG
ncbi:NUDIX domain-containing protein [Ideonella livida]|uniref:NUDIX domain-containing protein n=1 Tax=Ideonella livida TaxID=2707176 RepID=A0A7C9PKE7_9BURK|nr:NUDIX domain-containing protein [Ideonella livida]NDY93969.1 NUDIX domain-containing protein [Ideonella livida]